jgi:hypothetical protein
MNNVHVASSSTKDEQDGFENERQHQRSAQTERNKHINKN